MVLHDTMRIIILGRVMGKPHVITGARTRRQGTPHTMVLLATERMAIAILSLTMVIRLSAEKGKSAHLGLKTIIGHSAPSLHPKATLPLASSFLTPKVIALRIGAPTIDRVTNHTITTTVRHKITEGAHKDITLTFALRNTTKDVRMAMATIVHSQIGNLPMIIAIIVHTAMQSVTEARDIRASTKG